MSKKYPTIQLIWRQNPSTAKSTQTDMVNLTPNAVSMIFNNQTPDGFEPWLQIIDTKKIKPASGAGGDRYRCNDEQTD